MSGNVEHTREPCPDRILDEVGTVFAMGAIGGSVWHFLKGARNSPKGQRLLGAIDAVKVKGPATGGSFAIWASVFASVDCTMVGLRGKEDPWNSITSGAVAGGVLVARNGPAAMARSAIAGGVFLGVFECIIMGLSRLSSSAGPTPEDIQKMKQEMAEQEKSLRQGDAESSSSSSYMA